MHRDEPGSTRRRRRPATAGGRAEALLRLLERRSGKPTDAIVARVRGATLVDLDRWTDRILDARALADPFAE